MSPSGERIERERDTEAPYRFPNHPPAKSSTGATADISICCWCGYYKDQCACSNSADSINEKESRQ